MTFPTARHRRARVLAAALLLIPHLVAIGLLIHLRTTREHGSDRIATLLLLETPRKPAPPAPRVEPPRPPRAPVVPVPLVELEPQRLRDSATPIGAPEANATAAATAGPAAASAPLNLAIPKEFYTHPPPLTPAQEAMADPRSNHLVLTRQEQLDIAFGVVECIAWQREPDGSIYRGPGHRRRIQGLGTNPFTTHKPGMEDRPEECVK